MIRDLSKLTATLQMIFMERKIWKLSHKLNSTKFLALVVSIFWVSSQLGLSMDSDKDLLLKMAQAAQKF